MGDVGGYRIVIQCRRKKTAAITPGGMTAGLGAIRQIGNQYWRMISPTSMPPFTLLMWVSTLSLAVCRRPEGSCPAEGFLRAEGSWHAEGPVWAACACPRESSWADEANK